MKKYLSIMTCCVLFFSCELQSMVRLPVVRTVACCMKKKSTFRYLSFSDNEFEKKKKEAEEERLRRVDAAIDAAIFHKTVFENKKGVEEMKDISYTDNSSFLSVLDEVPKIVDVVMTLVNED